MNEIIGIGHCLIHTNINVKIFKKELNDYNDRQT